MRLPPHDRHGDGAGSRATRSRTGTRATATFISCRIWERCRWRAGSTRRRSVLCDVHDRATGTESCRLRLARFFAIRSTRRASWGSRRLAASELEYYVFRAELPSGGRARVPQPSARGLVSRGLPHPARDADRAVHRGGAPSSQGVWRPGRELERRMGTRPARAERPLRRSAADGRPPCRLQAVPEGSRPTSMGLSVTFMAKFAADRAGSSCHMHLSLWRDGRMRSPATPSSVRSSARTRFAGSSAAGSRMCRT